VSPPEVSILLPAFDAAATLEVSLRSVARQSEARWECIVVDDGSADGTRAVAERFAVRDARFRVVATAHRGLVAALNAGLEHCRGRVVARMDADDLMHRERLRLQLGALDAAPGLAAVGCHVRLFPRAGLTGRAPRLRALARRHRLARAGARRGLRRVPARAPDLHGARRGAVRHGLP
jgi:glycosyltransferase involved in cell wall biosynthesis